MPNNTKRKKIITTTTITTTLVLPSFNCFLCPNFVSCIIINTTNTIITNIMTTPTPIAIIEQIINKDHCTLLILPELR